MAIRAKVQKAARIVGAFGALAMRGKRIPETSPGRRILWLTSGPAGSLGEEALVLSALEHPAMAAESHTIAFLNGAPPSHLGEGRPDVQLVGLSRSGPEASTAARWVQLLGGHSEVVCLGADTLDGHYSDFTSSYELELVRKASLAGRSTSIISTSIATKIHPLTTRSWKRLPEPVRVVVRDALSHARLEAVIGKRTVLAADVAWLLEPRPQSPRVTAPLAWIQERRKQRQAILALSPGLHAFRGRDPTEVIEAFVRWTARLKDSWGPFAVVVVPHDIRSTLGAQSDHDVCQALASRLQGIGLPSKFAEIADCREAKAIIAMSDLVLTSRFHVSIAALSSSVPAVTVAYQGKVEGLYAALGLPGLVVQADDFLQGRDTIQISAETLQAARAQLALRVPSMKELALQNLVRV